MHELWYVLRMEYLCHNEKITPTPNYVDESIWMKDKIEKYKI